MDKTYKKLIEDIKLQAEAYSDLQMKSVYEGQKVALDKLHSLLGKLFIQYGVNGLLKMSVQQKGSVGIDKVLKDMIKGLANDEVVKVASILSDIYKDSYYKQIYTMNSGLKTILKFDILKPETIKSAVNTKMADEMFSDRIWANKVGLADKVKNSIVNAMLGNTTIDQVAREISDRFNVTAYESSRLVNNENARVQSQANEDMAVSTGVDQQMYSATLDDKTSEECQADDGKVWSIDDEDKVIPPENHIGCRCCLINVPYENWKPTNRRNNETGEDISYTNYVDWKKDLKID